MPFFSLIKEFLTGRGERCLKCKGGGTGKREKDRERKIKKEEEKESGETKNEAWLKKSLDYEYQR